ncbi:hypothetical protein GY45DRAFT_1155510 [Cubamyces sp. BRFM 1775]|nr:hypothetical protein GY45DRAFT_1155510 [Cubamyces sp. BRFM 1775]
MATTRGIQGLPPEIFDIILDSLGGTKSTLQSCSLICRTWLQASRRRLFSDLCVQAAEGRLSQFLTFIDTHSDIAGYVRSLTLSSPARYGAYWLPEDGYAEGRVTTQTLVALADVENAFRDDLPYELHVLHVSGSPRQEINSFLELLSRFPIRRLELDLVTFVQDPSISPVPLSLTPHREVTMRDLWVDLDTADDGPGILSALSSALSPDTLRVFHCRWRYWYECEAVGSFLRNMGYSIFDLALDMSTVSWIEEAGGMSA